jgi:hypothetical protein
MIKRALLIALLFLPTHSVAYAGDDEEDRKVVYRQKTEFYRSHSLLLY